MMSETRNKIPFADLRSALQVAKSVEDRVTLQKAIRASNPDILMDDPKAFNNLLQGKNVISKYEQSG
jgi:hypothetical protein